MPEDGGGVEEPADLDAGGEGAGPSRLIPGRALRDKLVLLHPLPEYTAIRTTRYLYVEYATGEREFYDLHRDPYEIHNLAGRVDGALEADLARRLARVRACRGSECRVLENAHVLGNSSPRKSG